MLWIVLASPGDGGIGAAIGVVGILAFAAAMFAVPISLLTLLVLGIPITSVKAGAVVQHPIWAILVGVIAGVSSGVLAGLVLFGTGSGGDLVTVAAISGGLTGCLWIILARRRIVAVRSLRPD
jgi:hypothetical protein